MARKRSRLWLTLSAGALVAAGLAYAFWPRSVMVDVGEAVHAPMMLTIDEEAKTRVVPGAKQTSCRCGGRQLDWTS